jgi:hypothetical protein
MPKLTENFDQLKMSSEIRSSDHSPKTCGELMLAELELDKQTFCSNNQS